MAMKGVHEDMDDDRARKSNWRACVAADVRRISFQMFHVLFFQSVCLYVWHGLNTFSRYGC